MISQNRTVKQGDTYLIARPVETGASFRMSAIARFVDDVRCWLTKKEGVVVNEFATLATMARRAATRSMVRFVLVVVGALITMYWYTSTKEDYTTSVAPQDCN